MNNNNFQSRPKLKYIRKDYIIINMQINKKDLLDEKE